jgi:hypothetical protein
MIIKGLRPLLLEEIGSEKTNINPVMNLKAYYDRRNRFFKIWTTSERGE